MLRVVKNWFHRPAIQMGRVDNSRIHTTRLRNAQFVSFFAEHGSFSTLGASDRYEGRLRRRKRLKWAFATLIASGGAWVALESARALTLF